MAKTGQTGVLGNPISFRAFKADNVIEMKTRGYPSGPGVIKTPITGRIYGSNCVY
jgi:hypothetical protein